ncbi:hypothetical protein ZTR_09347 [Talaromyces verruculosus]|nr:hypothetical protein ZTR_09347 [Talaromyces verruculosus]
MMAKEREFSKETDAAFISSYDSLNVHEKMIKDDVRTRSYLTAIEDNPQLFKDKIVLDIGTGTGILSMFAIRAGAKHVYATDISNMIHNARILAQMNGMADKITFIQGSVEEADLPQVDIIVSEWMGFCLLSEIMLDCLLRARDKHLAPGGLMFPDKTSLYLAAIEDVDWYRAKIDSISN